MIASLIIAWSLRNVNSLFCRGIEKQAVKFVHKANRKNVEDLDIVDHAFVVLIWAGWYDQRATLEICRPAETSRLRTTEKQVNQSSVHFKKK